MKNRKTTKIFSRLNWHS